MASSATYSLLARFPCAQSRRSRHTYEYAAERHSLSPSRSDGGDASSDGPLPDVAESEDEPRRVPVGAGPVPAYAEEADLPGWA
jgi:hypothetical protein